MWHFCENGTTHTSLITVTSYTDIQSTEQILIMTGQLLLQRKIG